MSANPMFHANPFLGPWLAASQSMAEAWLGPVARQQAATLADMNRQALRFWTMGWAQGAMSKAAPAPAATTPEPTAEPPMPVDLAPAMPAEPAPSAATEADEAAPRAAKRAKAPAPLRTSTQRRQASVMKRKPGNARTPRITRH